MKSLWLVLTKCIIVKTFNDDHDNDHDDHDFDDDNEAMIMVLSDDSDENNDCVNGGIVPLA